jgi:hypothetical protein
MLLAIRDEVTRRRDRFCLSHALCLGRVLKLLPSSDESSLRLASSLLGQLPPAAFLVAPRHPGCGFARLGPEFEDTP